MIGKTQQEMAEMFGISKQAYSQKERGHSRFTEKEMLEIKKLVSDEIPDIKSTKSSLPKK